MNEWMRFGSLVVGGRADEPFLLRALLLNECILINVAFALLYMRSLV